MYRTQSQLLDIKDCRQETFEKIFCEMQDIFISRQPWWFRPILKRSHVLQGWTDFASLTRPWEYPWAFLAAEMHNNSYTTLDVGGGGSPFSDYLAEHGHKSIVIDPSLDMGLNFTTNREKGIYRNIRSLIFRMVLNLTGISRMWGKPLSNRNDSVDYYSYSAESIQFPDNNFDRVFCLSTLEHIPVESWDQCMKEFERVLKPGGRLIITLDMTNPDANDRQYLKLVNSCSLKLVGDPYYEVPISQKDQESRHPGQDWETIGLVWQG